MSVVTNDQSTEEIIVFIKNIIDVNKSLKNSYGLVDAQNILNLFNSASNNDSGFESDAYFNSDYNTCLVPTSEINEILFEKNDLDLILENSLLAFCNYFQKINLDTKEKLKVNEKILDFVKEFIEYLVENVRNVPFREIIQTSLDSMLEESFTDENFLKFNFIMKLLQSFGRIKELEECVFDLIIKKLKTFCESISIENVDTSFSFTYEHDFSRAYTLLLTLMLIKAERSSYSKQNEEDIYSLLDYFKNLDEFFSLGFLCFRSISME